MPTKEAYDDHVIRLFLMAAAVWGVVSMSIGVLAAAQMAWPALNFDVSWLTFSRIRVNHTFGIIFGFGGSALMGTCYYIVQHTGHVRLAFGKLALFTFWGWQAVIVLAMATMPFGITQSKEYAEPEWFIDLLIAVVWVAFAVVFFGTLARRRIQHIYVSNWYYGALIIAVALLHIVNNLALPVSLTKSYTIYSGTMDAMVQWWYGHNAVAFFLTAGFLGMMYYFVPRQAQQPLWSYRFSIVNFWALISVYMWAGSHHLLYTALPDWVQSVGMVFSLVLLMPSIGSAANGLMTFNGSWHKVRVDPAAKFMVMALVFYAVSTFEGSMMAIKSVNSLTHFTDWTIAHVHAGAIGWVAMITIGSLYAMAPRALDRPAMHSTPAMNLHFWLHTSGLLIYVTSMWAAGVTQGLMWRATNPNGSLAYDFLSGLIATQPYYLARLLGGVLVLSGMVVMAWNLWHTAAHARTEVIKPILVPVPEEIPEPVPDQFPPPLPEKGLSMGSYKHWEKLEKNALLLGVLIAIVVTFGGLAEIIPLFNDAQTVKPGPGVKPYEPLRLAGRDVYVRENCYQCHSQMIRTLSFETQRYGDRSDAGEFVYDRPFQWGSKRTGPDLARIGGKYSDAWQRAHLMAPRDLVPQTNMPGYPWLAEAEIDGEFLQAKMRTLRTLGDPYTDAQIAGAADAVNGKTELDALVAYLQGLGVKAAPATAAPATAAVTP